MKAFTRKLSDPGPIELHDHHIFEEREAERDRLEAEHEETTRREPLPEPYNEYPCPNCEADVRVGLPAGKHAECRECGAKLEIHPSADWFDGFWHDRTTLSAVAWDGEDAEEWQRASERQGTE